MNRTIWTSSALVLLPCLALSASVQAQNAVAPAAPFKRNWTAPAYRMKGQALVDAVMAQHPELLGLTLHAVPPGKSEFTMFAGSYHDRIGKVSGPDDALATTLGRVMFETRYKPDDRKAVVLVPLRDAAGNDVATAVFGFRDPAVTVKSGPFYIGAAMAIADGMGRQIASHDDLFAQSN